MQSASSFSGSVISATTASTEETSTNKCQICKKNFVFRRKIQCFVCLSHFCSDHCQRKRVKNGELLSICNNCDVEETKKDILDEMANEICRVSAELKDVKEANESLFREHVNKVSMVNDIEMELSKQDWNHKKYEQDLASSLENEQNRGVRLRKTADELRSTLEELNSAEKSLSEQCSETEFLLETLKLEKTQLEVDKEDLVNSIEKVTHGLRQSLSVDEIRKLLCSDCLRLVNENWNSGNLDVVETSKHFHRDSLVSEELAQKNCILS